MSRRTVVLFVVVAALGALMLQRRFADQREPSGPVTATAAHSAAGSALHTTVAAPPPQGKAIVEQPPSADAVSGRALPAAAAATTAAVRLTFRLAESAQVGESVDLIADVESEQPVDRIVLAISYDPSLLRVRTAEDLDYTNTSIVHRFSVSEDAASRVVASVSARALGAPIGRSPMLGVVQFEPLAPGSAEVAVASAIVIAGAREVSAAVVSGVSRIDIHP
jgi:hypothetical protein